MAITVVRWFQCCAQQCRLKLAMGSKRFSGRCDSHARTAAAAAARHSKHPPDVAMKVCTRGSLAWRTASQAVSRSCSCRSTTPKVHQNSFVSKPDTQQCAPDPAGRFHAESQNSLARSGTAQCDTWSSQHHAAQHDARSSESMQLTYSTTKHHNHAAWVTVVITPAASATNSAMQPTLSRVRDRPQMTGT